MRRPLLAVCVCLVILAALRVKWGGSLHMPGDFTGASAILDREPVTVKGRVYRKEEKIIYLKNVSIQTSAAASQQNIPFTENIICEWEGEEILPGSTVLLQGTFRQFSVASNPGEFNQRSYYATIGIGGRLEDTALLGKGKKYAIVPEILYRIKTYWKERLYRIFPEKEASVMSAMLLGDKAELDGEIKSLYKRSGIIHILSISGLHITIIGMSIYRLLKRMGLPVWAAALVGGGLLLLYGVLTGLGVSACRAIGMYFIRMLGEICGRTYDMLTALGVMGALMALYNPLYLHHAGFLLSFGAVLGIGILYPALLPQERKQNFLKYESNPRKARFWKSLRQGRDKLVQSMCASISITAVTLPILLWFYYEAPVYSVFLNLCVLPLMKPVMMAGMLAMLVPGLGWLGRLDTVILAGYEFLCRLCGRLPFSVWNPGKPEMWQILIYYLMLAGFLAVRQFFHKRQGCGESMEKKRLLWGRYGRRAAGIFWLAASTAVLAVQMLPENKITFLDVGQGDCICIQTSSGKNYLFDCGSSSRSKIGSYVLLPFLKHEGITRLDAVFVSHPDADHCNGLEELFAGARENGIGIDRLVLPDIAETEKTEEFASLLNAAEQMSRQTPEQGRQQAAVQYIKTGDAFGDAAVYFICLHPPKGYLAEANAYSECFYVEFGGRAGKGKNGAWASLLLTGDVEGEGERLLLNELEKRGIKDIMILKTAHHGSRNSTGKELLAQLRPRLAVISCGKDNSYGHPHEELLERLEETGAMLLQTPETGAVTVKWERNLLKVEGRLDLRYGLLLQQNGTGKKRER